MLVLSRKAVNPDSGRFQLFEVFLFYFDPETGGYVVTHRDRIESGNSSPNEKEKFYKEQDMCKDLATAGHHIEHLSDKDRSKRRTYDIHMDGVRADLKSVSSANNIEKYTRKAVSCNSH